MLENEQKIMPRNLDFYLQEGKLNWDRLDCVVGEISRMWSNELHEASIKANQKSIKVFRDQTTPIMTETDQTCMKFFNRAHKKAVVTRSERNELELKLYVAQLKQKNAEIKMLKARLELADKLKSAYAVIKTALE